MDVKFQLSILQTQSEYVRKLATDLTTTLSALEQMFMEQMDNSHLTTSDYDERIAEVQRLLIQQMEVLRQRLKELDKPSVPHE